MASSPGIKEYLSNLQHPLLHEILLLRQLILEAGFPLEEQIKWGCPSYALLGEDKITFNFPPKQDRILLVFHRGAKVKDPIPHRLIDDPQGILLWKTNDRAIATFTDSKSIHAQDKALTQVIKDWLQKA
jgi:hypothetical protein